MPLGTLARMTELLTAISITPGASINAPPVIGKFKRFSMVRTPPATYNPTTESDAGEYGNGDEFGRQNFPVAADTSQQIDKYSSSEFAAVAWAHALGNVAVTGAGPYVYTITPQVAATTGIELPYFHVIEQIRPGGSAVLDRIVHGCAVNRLAIQLNSGPGRQNSRILLDWIGSGKITTPSALTMPAATTENLLNAGGLAMTINGENYVTDKNFVSAEFGVENNLDPQSGYFPGSGTDANGFQLRGRIWFGNRTPFFNFTALFANGSPELASLLAQTTGTAVASLTKDANNSMVVTYQKVAFRSAVVGPGPNGTVAVQCSLQPLYDATNGVLSVVVTTPLAGVLQ